MTEPKLYGIERADGTVVEGASPSLWLDRNPIALAAGVRDGELIVEVALIKKERLDAAASALEPFAHFFEQFSKKPISQLDDEFYMIHAGTEWEASLRLSDMKLAAEALADLRSGR